MGLVDTRVSGRTIIQLYVEGRITAAQAGSRLALAEEDGGLENGLRDFFRSLPPGLLGDAIGRRGERARHILLNSLLFMKTNLAYHAPRPRGARGLGVTVAIVFGCAVLMGGCWVAGVLSSVQFPLWACAVIALVGMAAAAAGGLKISSGLKRRRESMFPAHWPFATVMTCEAARATAAKEEAAKHETP